MILLHNSVKKNQPKNQTRFILKSSPAPAVQKHASPCEDSNSKLV